MNNRQKRVRITFRSRRQRNAAISAICAVVTLSILWLAWEYIGRLDTPKTRLFPPPTKFLSSLADSNFRVGLGAQSATIIQSVAASVLRVVGGLSIAFISGLAVAVVATSNIWIKRFLFPVVQLLAPIAPVAWIPLGLVAFGIGNTTALFIVFMGVFFTITIAATHAIESVPDGMIESSRALGCNRAQIVVWVVLPYCLPAVFTILRLNFVAAWMAVLAAEMTGLGDGLGAVVMIGRNLFNNNLILLGMVLIGVTGFIVDALLVTIQRRFFWWNTK